MEMENTIGAARTGPEGCPVEMNALLLPGGLQRPSDGSGQSVRLSTGTTGQRRFSLG